MEPTTSTAPPKRVNDGLDRERLISLREKRGLSGAEVANRLKISRSRYNNYEKGWRAMPLTILRRLPQILDCTLSDLLSVY